MWIGKIVARPVQPEIAKVLNEPDRLIEAVVKFVADSDDALPFVIRMRRVTDVTANGDFSVGIRQHRPARWQWKGKVDPIVAIACQEGERGRRGDLQGECRATKILLDPAKSTNEPAERKRALRRA